MEGNVRASTLIDQHQNMVLQATATVRGNEGPQNYFDPSAAAEGDPRRCRMSGVGGRDELELKFMNEDENNLLGKLSEMLQEEDNSTIIDLPGMAMSDHNVEDSEPSCGWKDHLRAEQLERRSEVMPHYIEELRKHVQKDMIPVGRPAMAQEEHLEKRMTEEKAWARKQRVISFLSGNSKIRNINKEEDIFQERPHNAFQRTETRLLNALHPHQDQVIDQYGEIIEEAGSMDTLGFETDLQWKVEWTRTPQPIEVHVLCLRAVREKLPKGLYSLTVSLHSELGGRPLRWSRVQEQRWTGSTEPVHHAGRYCDTDLNINQSLYMLSLKIRGISDIVGGKLQLTVLPASCDLLPSTVILFKLLTLPSDHSHVGSVVGWGVFPVCDVSFNLLHGNFKTPLLRGRPDPSLNLFCKIEHLLSTDLDNWLCNLYFQVKRLPRGSTGMPEQSFTLQVPAHPQQSSRHQDISTLSSASVPGKSSTEAESALEPRDQTNHPNVTKTTAEIHRETGRQKKMIGRNREMLAEDQLDQFSFSVRSQKYSQLGTVAVCCGTAERIRLLRRLLPSLLDLSRRARMSQKALNLMLFIIMWFPRLYLHYCGQWLYLQSKHIPINKFGLGAHTVDLVYQGSLLSTLEEVLLVLLGPLTLSGVVLLMLLITWGCQLAFGSPPSLLSKFIMAAAVWTVLDPLAVFTMDAILGRLSYSADDPLADAAKLYWHFHRTEQSGTAGIIITLFLYSVHLVLSLTILYIYILRLHNDGKVLDIYQRLCSAEEAFFIPHDMEVSNQELNYIVKKAEQWRGFNGERRKVAVYDYIWTEEGPAAGSAQRVTGCEISTHLSIYTLHLSGLRQHYRHFLRQPDGSIIEVMKSSDSPAFQMSEEHKEPENIKRVTHLRERKTRRAVWRSHRVEPLGESVCDSNTEVKDVS